jgi:hypothetical protein
MPMPNISALMKWPRVFFLLIDIFCLKSKGNKIIFAQRLRQKIVSIVDVSINFMHTSLNELKSAYRRRKHVPFTNGFFIKFNAFSVFIIITHIINLLSKYQLCWLCHT